MGMDIKLSSIFLLLKYANSTLLLLNLPREAVGKVVAPKLASTAENSSLIKLGRRKGKDSGVHCP